MSNSSDLDTGLAYLATQGFNLYHCFDVSSLPAEVVAMMPDAPLQSFSRLILLGAGGNRFWPAFTAAQVDTANPVDDYSIDIASRFIAEHLAGADSHVLYPGPMPVPLQRLGTLAGWSHPSPLGLGINATYGVWFAYRAAFLTTAPITPSTARNTTSPCATCADKPCVTACPAGAVHTNADFDIPACIQFRLSDQSPCYDRCLARMACPFFPEHRYPLAQIQHHYGFGVEALRRYIDD